jgi:hypothetical protein
MRIFSVTQVCVTFSSEYIIVAITLGAIYMSPASHAGCMAPLTELKAWLARLARLSGLVTLHEKILARLSGGPV